MTAEYDSARIETSDELDAEGRPKFPRAAALPAHPETLARAREAVNAARTLPRGLR